MALIAIDEDAYRALLERIDRLSNVVGNLKVKDLASEWLVTEDLCRILRATKRSIQSYRDRGVLKYAQIEGKIFYRRADIEQLLETNLKNHEHRR